MVAEPRVYEPTTRSTVDNEDVDSTSTHNTHLCITVCSQARNAHHALGSSHHGLHFIFVRLKESVIWFAHVSPFVLSPAVYLEHFSFTLPSTTTQEHAAQSVQQDQLQEHALHLEHLQALPADKLRHQGSPWLKNLQSGGKTPRTTTPTGHEPEELATDSRIEDYSGDPYQSHDVQEIFGEVHRAPITEEVGEFGDSDGCRL